MVQPGDGDAPAGFTGGNDRWFRHESLCVVDGRGVVGPSAMADSDCEALGGRRMDGRGRWMLHVWVVPGCENDWGVFARVNPRLPALPDGAALAPGCGSFSG